MGKNFWIILGVIILAAGGLVFFLGSGDDESNGSSSEVLTVTDADFKRGPEGATVSVIEYADFQCPACSVLAPLVDEMYRQFGDQVEFVFRHFPLTTIHPNAMAAHRAAQAAGNQGMFWEMHDLLFQRQQAWASVTSPNAIFESYAQELNLDINQFSQDASSEEASKAINSSVSGGLEVGVSGTPSYFVAGTKIDTPQSVEEFTSAIQAALDVANNQENTPEPVE